MKFLQYNPKKQSFGTWSKKLPEVAGWFDVSSRKVDHKTVNGFIWTMRDKYGNGTPGIDEVKKEFSKYKK